MRFLWIAGGVLAVIVAAMFMFASCQRQAVNASLKRSTAPLLVPQGEWRDAYDFTAPPGATDLYQLRWNFRVGGTDGLGGWQVASTSTYDAAALAEGPGQAIVDEALRAARGDGCEVADAERGIQICTYEAEFALGGINAYLVRLEQNQILVIEYVNRGGDRGNYDPASLEARFINAEFEAIPIDGDIGDYLVYIY